MDISVYFLVDIGVGVLLGALAIPMALGRVKPNRWYGFRTPKTLASESVWYQANRYAGKGMLIAAAAMIAMAAIIILLYKMTTLLSSLSPVAVLLLWTSIMMVPILAMTVASLLYLKKL